jgi:micrococcal nuclease
MNFRRRWKKLPSPFRLRSRVWRRDKWVFLAAFAAVALLYVIRIPARRPLKPSPDAPPLVVSPKGLVHSEPSRLVRVPVAGVVDGDTVRVVYGGETVSLRYFGVDTPEIGEPCYEEAAERNRALAAEWVGMAFDRRTRDPGGRLLAYAFTEDGLSVEAALIREGLGRAWRRDGVYRGDMIRLEEEARREKSGCLWQ